MPCEGHAGGACSSGSWLLSGHAARDVHARASPLSPNPTNPFLALRALPTLSPRAEISTLLLDGMYAFESAEAAGTGDDAAPRGSQGAVAGTGVVEEYDELLMELDG